MENIVSCRICKNKNIKTFFELGKQPLANSLPKSLDKKENFYPLSLSWCPDCSLVQLNQTIDPEVLFSEYVWITATSETAQEHSQAFFKELSSRSSKKGYVLEIGSNDGTFLKPFIRNGYDVLGIDPAKNIAEIAEKNGIPTRAMFFGSKTASDLVKEKGKANIIFARNVLPHVANTRDFVQGLEMCLSKDGVLAIEVHYAKKILEELHYDSIYHEHLCYFTLKSLERLLNNFNLYIFDTTESPISGGSIVVYAKYGRTKEEPIVQQYRDQERENQINEFKNWENFAQKAIVHRQELLEALKEAKLQGSVAGYGASARSSTLLNFAKIDANLISNIADQSSLKQGRFTAGTHIPIISPEEMINRNPDAIVILAWNFADEISNILRNKFNYKGRIIIPLPNTPKII